MDGEPPQEEDFSQIPLVERSQHKVNTLVTTFSSDLMSELESSCVSIYRGDRQVRQNSFRLRPILSPLHLRWVFAVSIQLVCRDCLTGRKKWCLDANAVAQEKGIEAVLAIVQNSGETSSR